MVDDNIKLYMFSATWCGKCQAFHRVLDRTIPMIHIDVDNNEAVAQIYNISILPTFVLEKEGKEIGRLEQPYSVGEFASWYEQKTGIHIDDR